MGTDTTKDLIAGATGGASQVLIGQPFDIVKVRLQAHRGRAAEVAQNILRKEGPLAFYKGTLTPLLGVGACVSIQFGAFHYFRSCIEHSRRSSSLSLFDYYLAGGAAGLTNSVISGPIEHVRIRLQTQPHGDAKLYNGPLDCVRKIMKEAGPTAIYRGQVVTLLPSLSNGRKKNRSEIPSWKFAVCGGLAGELLWLFSHPLDVIKSKMQSDGFGEDQKFKTMRDAFKMTWRDGGLPALWEGLGTALFRALPVSAGTFAVVELVRNTF